MGHTQDTPHMKIADLEDTITELEQENRELQISCDGFAEQCSKLEATIHNIEEGLRRLDNRLQTDSTIVHDGCDYVLFSDAHDDIDKHTLAELIDEIRIGGTTDEA